ncbi:MAG: PAS domain-containing protein [Taibaiella sp.]|nr:PAS domain-containing protein [Taibaiella sp.]
MLKNKFYWPYILFFLSIAALAGINYAKIEKEARRNTRYPRVLNDAGRQRMLSQLVTKLCYEDYLGGNKKQQILDNARTWNQVHYALTHNSANLTRYDPALTRQIAAIGPVEQALYHSFLQAGNGKINATLLNEINARAQQYLPRMDAIVNSLEYAAERHQQYAQRSEATILLLSALVLVLEMLVFIYPYHKKLMHGYNKMIRQQDELESQSHLRKALNDTYELLVKGIAAGVWDRDIETGQEQWSAKFYQLLGYEENEIPATYACFTEQLLHPNDKERVQTATLRHLLHQEPYKEEVRLKHKDDTYRWYEISGQAKWDEDGRPIRMAGSLIDVEDMVNARMEVTDNQFLLEEAGKIALLGAWDMDILKKEMKWSKTIYDIYEAEPDYKLTVNRLANYAPEHHALINEAMHKAQKDGAPFDIEVKLITVKGNVKWIRSIGIPIKDNSGRVVRLRGLYQDIDKQKQREEELIQIKDRVEEINKTKDKLFSIIAHDLKGPINSLQSLLDLVQDGSISTDEFTVYVAEVQVNVRFLNDAMDKMLQWAKSQMQGLSISPVTLNIMDVINNCLGLYDVAIAAKNLTIDIKEGKPGITCFADHDHVTILLRNLINNAVKFTPVGGNITIKVNEIGSKVFIHIIDSGIGLNVEQLEQARNRMLFTTRGTEGEKGTGLGLYLCYELAEKNGGKIDIDSKEGKGAKFTLSLLSGV